MFENPRTEQSNRNQHFKKWPIYPCNLLLGLKM